MFIYMNTEFVSPRAYLQNTPVMVKYPDRACEKMGENM